MLNFIANAAKPITDGIGKTGKNAKKEVLTSIKEWFKELPNQPYFYWVLGGIFLVMVCTFIYKKIKKRRQAKGPVAPIIPLVKAGELLKVWKGFLAKIPGDFRRVIRMYRPFVVIGGAGSGKSKLIDKYTDWEGMANQFYPSFINSDKLQLYLGTQSVVQELSPAILEDSSKSTRKALKKLWKKTFKGGAPTVVLAVRADTLNSESSDVLKSQAQLLRGKINVLAWVRREAVQTRVAITRMDSVTGYSEFADFLSSQGIKLVLDTSDCSPKTLATALEPYERYLSLALTTLPSEQYLKIVAFLNEAPSLLAKMGSYIQTLTMSEPLSPEPMIEELFLTSSLDENKTCEPFEVPMLPNISRSWTQYRHRKFAAIIVSLGLLYGYAGYYYQNETLTDLEIEIQQLEGSKDDYLHNKDHENFLPPVKYIDANNSLGLNPGRKAGFRFFPSFFTNRVDALNSRVSKNVSEFKEETR